MHNLSLVCVREDAQKGELLAEALERYGFNVCRSATVFEEFQGYAAVLVLLSPAAMRSPLVTQTAERAMDWGKLLPVFMSFCQLPNRMSGLSMHDLSCWEGDAEDKVVVAIAAHVMRLTGAGPKAAAPQLGPPRERAPALEPPYMPPALEAPAYAHARLDDPYRGARALPTPDGYGSEYGYEHGWNAADAYGPDGYGAHPPQDYGPLPHDQAHFSAYVPVESVSAEYGVYDYKEEGYGQAYLEQGDPYGAHRHSPRVHLGEDPYWAGHHGDHQGDHHRAQRAQIPVRQDWDQDPYHGHYPHGAYQDGAHQNGAYQNGGEYAGAPYDDNLTPLDERDAEARRFQHAQLPGSGEVIDIRPRRPRRGPYSGTLAMVGSAFALLGVAFVGEARSSAIDNDASARQPDSARDWMHPVE